ncbi:unannotated protein [freshwater metagenome]|uniref:Unannotated protein n=1 Tax=freshwater metagenome TaxID=449393 RepID=A0A6J7RWK0_9ZZZZ
MRRVDKAVGDVEAHRIVANAFKVASPPVAVKLLTAGDRAFDALDQYEPVWRVGENCVSGQLGSAAPVVCGSGAPSCLTVRLVLEVGADYVRLACVTG